MTPARPHTAAFIARMVRHRILKAPNRSTSAEQPNRYELVRFKTHCPRLTLPPGFVFVRIVRSSDDLAGSKALPPDVERPTCRTEGRLESQRYATEVSCLVSRDVGDRRVPSRRGFSLRA